MSGFNEYFTDIAKEMKNNGLGHIAIERAKKAHRSAWEAANASRWTKCTDKLPPHGEPVLAKIKASDEVVAAYIVGDMWIEQHISYKPTEMFSTYRFEICRVGDGVITEWMEMPR